MFVGEVVLVLVILAMSRFIGDAVMEGRRPHLDGVGTVLSASGLGLIVLGRPAVDDLGLGAAQGLPGRAVRLLAHAVRDRVRRVPLWSFVALAAPPRERAARTRSCTSTSCGSRRCARGSSGLFTQNLILMGVFFVVPLYLQLVLGLDALQTGIKMLPVSITMFLASAIGSRLSASYSVRTIVRAGLLVTVVAVVALLATVQPDLADRGFATSMAILGVGMGLMVSQLGNVVQSSVDASGRGEAGGLQYTGQQLGSSLGVALIGAIVLSGLTSVFVTQIQADERISAEVAAQVTIAVEPGIDFVSADQVAAAAKEAGLDEATTAALARRLRDRPDPVAQGRPARGRGPRAGLPRVHPEPAARAARRPRDPGAVHRRRLTAPRSGPADAPSDHVRTDAGRPRSGSAAWAARSRVVPSGLLRNALVSWKDAHSALPDLGADMARVVVLGAGISGHTAALHLRRLLEPPHEVVVVSPNSQWNWIPSNIWVGVGRMKPAQVTFPLRPVYDKHGIDFRQAKAVALHPEGDASHGARASSTSCTPTPHGRARCRASSTTTSSTRRGRS